MGYQFWSWLTTWETTTGPKWVPEKFPRSLVPEKILLPTTTTFRGDYQLVVFNRLGRHPGVQAETRLHAQYVAAWLQLAIL